jgi:membrane protease YdiL (CAAX protease family)
MQLKKYNHPVIFYGVVITISWVFWFVWAWLSRSKWYENPSVAFGGLILGLSGLCTPFAVAMVLILPDRENRQELVSQIINFKGIRPIFWILSFLLFPLSILLAQAISLPFGGSVSQFKITENMSFAGVFPAWVLLTAGPILEEFGWHTYGTHCLRNRLNLFLTSILFAIIWGMWHIPLSRVQGHFQNEIAVTGVIYEINYFVSILPYMLICNWMYYKTNRNLFLVILFHFEAGFFAEIFQTHPDSKIIQTILLSIVSIIIICKEKIFFFGKAQEEIPRH